MHTIYSEFQSEISGRYLEYSYMNVLISETNYSFIFNNQKIKKKTDFIYFKLNAATAGNILSGINKLTNKPNTNGNYQLFGTEYAQYIRADFDFRYYQILNDANNIVYRINLGVGYPYGNSEALPFVKKFFSGGANSIRAWQVRSLGPGSYNKENSDEENDGEGLYYNQLADIKIEVNLEYRFKLFWVLEGALFIDAGNIWAISNQDERERPGSLFKVDKFYKDIAIGTGLGARFDFSYFIFRLDVGLKARDPKEPEGEKWILGSGKVISDEYRFKDITTFNIGIGYPF